ncbi:MAG: gamma-glutamyltransferase family protein [Spirochaetaceae bacterium]|nr:MAG: gamma-glutamyltransferase family protein [Spirochaetaceae bacterium]
MQLDGLHRYHSRRSPVVARGGMVASSQPLANAAGLRVLDAGGSAADAAVAVAAALQVTQPCSTGLGGDAFWLYFDAGERRVYAANGSGRSPVGLSVEAAVDAAQAARAAAGATGAGSGKGGHGAHSDRFLRLPPFHAHTVTVPGAAGAWELLLERFGRLPRASVVAPAVRLAADGFPVAPITAEWWTRGVHRQLAHFPHGHELMAGGAGAAGGGSAAGATGGGNSVPRGPEPGETMRLPTLAWSIEQFGLYGAEPFYRGEIARRIVAAVQAEGGVLSMEDLAAHETLMVEPISLEYRGSTVWECPPNGQGLAALVALGVVGEYEKSRGQDASLHVMIEAMRLGFAAAAQYVADPDIAPAPVAELLSPGELRVRAQSISDGHRLEVLPSPAPGAGGNDTVYFCTADREGNVCSFINSNFMGFGTGIVPEGCGFSLQNRGHGFVLDAGHANSYAPGKRPYHTIIPGMITAPDGTVTAFGVMGGMMQPQGHLQTAVALLRDDIDPQSALDRPRFQLNEGEADGEVLLEAAAGPSATAPDALTALGHTVRVIPEEERAIFGLGAIIRRTPDGTLWGASDPRGDGAAAGTV